GLQSSAARSTQSSASISSCSASSFSSRPVTNTGDRSILSLRWKSSLLASGSGIRLLLDSINSITVGSFPLGFAGSDPRGPLFRYRSGAGITLCRPIWGNRISEIEDSISGLHGRGDGSRTHDWEGSEV